MLALKQALEVLEFNEKRSESAHVVNRIGEIHSKGCVNKVKICKTPAARIET